MARRPGEYQSLAAVNSVSEAVRDSEFLRGSDHGTQLPARAICVRVATRDEQRTSAYVSWALGLASRGCFK